MNFARYTILLILSFFTQSYAYSKVADTKTEESFKKRLEEEIKSSKLEYSFSAHKPFYILPVSYNLTPNEKDLNELSEVDKAEVKFQFSFKFNLVERFLNDHFQLSFAYTSLSFWQLYNKTNSAPFRETNHEPDLYISYRPQGEDFKATDHFYRLGLVHQSNGQNVPQSRSWNRVYVQGIFNLSHAVVALKLWQRIQENKKESDLSSSGDDNPNIEKYLGHFELNLMKKISKHTFSSLIRNNFRQENRGALELSWSFPMNDKLKGYFQYFNGYGESLIDYDSAVERVGIGILLADWI